MSSNTRKRILSLALLGVAVVLACGGGIGCGGAEEALYQRLRWSTAYPASPSPEMGQWSRKTGDLWYDRARAASDVMASALLDDDFKLVVRAQMSSPYGGFQETWFIENAHEAFSLEIRQNTCRVGAAQVESMTVEVHSIPMRTASLAADKLGQLSIFQLHDLAFPEYIRAGATATTDGVSYLVSAAAPGESNQFVCGGIVWGEDDRQRLRDSEAGLQHLKVTDPYVGIIRCIDQLSEGGSSDKGE